MDAEILLGKVNNGESAELECKSTQGGVPKDLWYTYSDFANTNGGIILLGMEENRGTYTPRNVDINRLQKNFWDTTNNFQKVSTNILREYS